jgi:hypothetical protein
MGIRTDDHERAYEGTNERANGQEDRTAGPSSHSRVQLLYLLSLSTKLHQWAAYGLLLSPDELDASAQDFVKRVIQYHGPNATIFREVVCRSKGGGRRESKKGNDNTTGQRLRI